MATKEDMILQEIREIKSEVITMGKDVAVLKYVSESIEELKTDMAVLKSKHDTGNKSERISAVVACVALLISVCVSAVSCRECISEKDSKRPTPLRVIRAK